MNFYSSFLFNVSIELDVLLLCFCSFVKIFISHHQFYNSVVLIEENNIETQTYRPTNDNKTEKKEHEEQIIKDFSASAIATAIVIN